MAQIDIEKRVAVDEEKGLGERGVRMGEGSRGAGRLFFHHDPNMRVVHRTTGIAVRELIVEMPGQKHDIVEAVACDIEKDFVEKHAIAVDRQQRLRRRLGKRPRRVPLPPTRTTACLVTTRVPLRFDDLRPPTVAFDGGRRE